MVPSQLLMDSPVDASRSRARKEARAAVGAGALLGRSVPVEARLETRLWKAARAFLLWATPLLGVAGPAAQAFDASVLTPFHYGYQLSRGGSVVGRGSVRLEPDQREGCFLFSQTAKPTTWWLKAVSGPVIEQSWFCIREGKPQPTVFRYHREGVGAERENYSVNFDWARGVYTNERGDQHALVEDTLDRLLMQLVLREWIVSAVATTGQAPTGARVVRFAERDKIEDYTFELRARETVNTPAGSFDTVRLDRTDSRRRRAQFWLAPELNYAVVKAEQQRDDDPVIRLLLSAVPNAPAAP